MYDLGWSDHDTISAFLTYHRRRGDTHWVSSLVAVLRDARAATGRYLASGKVSPNRRVSGSWLGALGYMVMLDQIGECFRPANATPLGNTPDFIKAILYFTEEIPEREHLALYALRCCFAHDYSLVNIPPKNNKKREELLHHFRLSDDPAPCPVVVLPAVPWDGNIARRSISTATRVSLQCFGDLAESVYARLLDLHSRRKLSIALPGGSVELRARYAFTVFPDAPRGERPS